MQKAPDTLVSCALVSSVCLTFHRLPFGQESIFSRKDNMNIQRSMRLAILGSLLVFLAGSVRAQTGAEQTPYDARTGVWEILTPQPGDGPRINGPRIYGARPDKQFVFRIPCQGRRPIQFKASGLPDGLVLNTETGVIGGRTPSRKGTFSIKFSARNETGSDSRSFKLVVGDRIALTPPMGWNSWGGHMLLVSDKVMRQATDLMVNRGLADVGFQYVSIDDCWMRIDLTAGNIGDRLTPTSKQINCVPSADGLVVHVAPGDERYPGIRIKPEGNAWDLSAFGHVEVNITNTDIKPLKISLRVDNAGDWHKNPFNTEGITIPPGKTDVVKVIFGYQYGMKPGFDLNPREVVALLLFTVKTDKPKAFRLNSIIATGPAGEKPPVNPQDVRIEPTGGYILGGNGVPIDASKQVDAPEGVTAKIVSLADRQMLRLVFPSDKKCHQVSVRPPIGRWDLRQASEVRVKLRNVGSTPTTATVQVTADRRAATNAVTTDTALRPDEMKEILVPFQPAKPWQGPSQEVTGPNMNGRQGTGTKFRSDRVDAIRIVVDHGGDAAVLIESIRASAKPVQLPNWLGKRPPVDGNWTMTFRDEFDGNSVDQAKWNVYGPNWWGSSELTHWSKDNVIVADGLAKIHFEKKRGFHNDDPQSGHQSNYTGGYLDTDGKWAQKYGYFEARMKLPTAPGLWPAFWTMPDRGPDEDPQWKRRSTEDGGMEFDIMEHLTRWGPYRYNIAMHWDGYGKHHKSIGTSNIYIQPDTDGFITCGLLWTPGSAAFYCNGKEVGRWDAKRIANVPSLLMFTMPVGGWDNSRLDDKRLPDDFVIDYVRVWQRKDLASAVNGLIKN